MKRPGTRHGLAARIWSAAIALPLVCLALWVGGWILWGACAVVTCLGIYEAIRMVRRMGVQPLKWAGYAAGILPLAGAQLPAERHAVLVLMGLLIGLALACLLLARQHKRTATRDWLVTFGLSLYVGIPFACLIRLRSYNVWWLLTALIGTWAFDSGAYFIGRSLGRHALAPKISPNKTWEGFAGGVVFAVAAALCSTVSPLRLTWIDAVLLGLCISAVATIGDLLESALKRRADVKDSGRIMPGHGGILDRIDGLLWTSTLVFLFAQIYGK